MMIVATPDCRQRSHCNGLCFSLNVSNCQISLDTGSQYLKATDSILAEIVRIVVLFLFYSCSKSVDAESKVGVNVLV